MTPVSRRYIRPLTLIVIPVLVPVIIHSYGDLKTEDCHNADALFPPATPRQPGSERDTWMRKNFDAVRWAEGSFSENDPPLNFEFVIIRSYDAKNLYHRPENAFRKGIVSSRTMEWLPGQRDSVPIHLLRYERSDFTQLGAYLLAYNSSAVGSPYFAQLAAFPSQLITGLKPMTMFLIFGRGSHSTAQALENRAKLWLAASWERYTGACLAGLQSSELRLPHRTGDWPSQRARR